MSGHSKWAKIKRQKGVNDAKKGAMFTKLARNISLAAREGGADPDSNFTLRLAISKAKEVNMPSDNIERAVKKGSGGGEKSIIQRLSYEAFFDQGVGILVDCQTDNTNRTYSEVKNLIEANGGKMASAGSVSWQFTEKGWIVVRPAKHKKAEKFGAEDSYEAIDPEAAQLELFEIDGIADFSEAESEDEAGNSFSVFEIATDKNDFARVHKKIEELGFQIVSFELIKEAKDLVDVTPETKIKLENLVEAVEEHDDVDAVWTSAK